MKNKYLRFAFVISATVSLNSCLYKTPISEPVEGDVSFMEDVEPIFETQGCVACHPSDAGLDLMVGKAYESIFANSLVNLEKPEESIIYAHPKESHPKTYTPAEANIVLAWIEQGAKDN